MRVLSVNSIDIYIPITTQSAKEQLVSEGVKKYYYKPDERFLYNVYNHFNFILNDDGSLWEDGNRYLLWKIRYRPRINATTIKSIADKLKAFKEFCDSKDINYRVAPRKFLRPNWLYREQMIKRIGKLKSEGGIEPSTVQRHVSEVNNFLQWLIDIEGVRYKYDLWKESEVFISYGDGYGVQRGKIVKTKDASQVPTSSNNQVGGIFDGESLKALTEDEQFALLDALEELENPEMTLGFLISLTTGARMQTVYTLRLKQFVFDIPQNNKTDEWLKGLDYIADNEEIKISVGPGTGCDTKGDKYYNLFFPGWLVNHIKIYISSERASRRRKKASLQETDIDQYLFLTKSMNPFYMSKYDINNTKYDQPPNGGAVRNFLYMRLSEKLIANGHKFKFKFHDLRATFGMNFLDFNKPLVDEGKITELALLGDLQGRMAHDDINTTIEYLNFRNMQKYRRDTQNKFELKMKRILDVKIYKN